MIDTNQKNNDDVKDVQDNTIKDQEKSMFSAPENKSEVDDKDNQIIQLELKLSQIQEQERDTILRCKAEVENVRKRSMQEIEKAHRFSLERFVFELLPVIDNLERTLNIIDRSNELLISVIEGIELTLKSFLDTVNKFGLESIYKIDVPFDPLIHQAISTVDSEEHQSNQVLTMIQKGYLLNGRLIRPAMVIVSSNKSK